MRKFSSTEFSEKKIKVGHLNGKIINFEDLYTEHDSTAWFASLHEFRQYPDIFTENASLHREDPNSRDTWFKDMRCLFVFIEFL